MSGSPPRVLVTDAHSTAALAIVRSLGAAGMQVTVAGEQDRVNLAFRSRHVRRTVTCVSADEQPVRYGEELLAELRNGYDLLIPATDSTVAIVRHYREQFDASVLVALPANSTLDAAVDKSRTLCCANQHDVAAPRSWHFESIDALDAAADNLPYPAVVKPRWSRQWTGTGPIVRGAVTYARSPADLRNIYRSAPRGPASLLVQQLVSGQGVGVFVLADRGEPVVVFAHRRVREANPTGGRASLAESIAPSERITAPALRLLRALGWHGVAMVEFKDPGAPGEPTLMEVNGRFWGSLPLAIACGVDFPALLARMLLGQRIEPRAGYPIGVRCRHLHGDVSYLVAALKGRPRGWDGGFPSRLDGILAVLPWPGRWRPYNFSLDDPRPALYEAGRFIVDELASVTSRVTPANQGRGHR